MAKTPRFPKTRHLAWRQVALGLGVVSLTLAFVPVARPAAPPAPQAKATAQSAAADVARGEYLANHVAMCVQCHSPRDANGAIRMAEKFRGGTIPFKSPWPNSEWAHRAPNLAGLPGLTEEQMVALLTQGRATGREVPRSPMPQFRMSPSDAAAILAYLRSL